MYCDFQWLSLDDQGLKTAILDAIADCRKRLGTMMDEFEVGVVIICQPQDGGVNVRTQTAFMAGTSIGGSDCAIEMAGYIAASYISSPDFDFEGMSFMFVVVEYVPGHGPTRVIGGEIVRPKPNLGAVIMHQIGRLLAR